MPGQRSRVLSVESAMKRVLSALLLAAALLSAGCRPNYIPNTDVEDNDSNRRIVEFCEEYRRAVERRNVAQLLALAHPSYYENGGNIDASDDIDYAGLREFLETKFRETRAIRYEIRYRRIEESPKKTLWVDYTYSASYKVPSEGGEVWRRQVADNRLELIPVEDGYRIVGGM
jgi:hypothetical protein